MRNFLASLRYLLAILTGLASLLTLVSVVPTSVWWVQVLGFPRLQTLGVLTASLLGLLALGWPAHRQAWRRLLLGGGVGLLIQGSFLWPYLPFAPQAVPTASPAQVRDSTGRLRIMVINVLITNRQDARLRQLVQATQPDILLALEPDAWWARALRPLQPQYPYRVELPRPDAYGMILYSRLPLANTLVQDLLQRGVPSIRTQVQLRNGQRVRLFAVHPTPPIPDNYPDGVGRRGRALNKVANFVQDDSLPTIVAGDFNDVSWSATIHQLTRTGQLRDVSRGRGFYNTFDARSTLARWPLDHFFVSAPWRVVALRRLPDVGSDHFPLYLDAVLVAK